MDPCLRLKLVNDALVDVLAPVIDVKLVGVGCRKVEIARIADTSHDQKGRQHNGCLSGPQRFLSVIRHCILPKASRSRLRLRLRRGKVCDEKQSKDRHEDHSGQSIHRRLDAAAHLTVDQGRQCIDPGTSRKVGDDKIIQRHCKRHQETRQYARKNIREHRLKKSL